MTYPEASETATPVLGTPGACSENTEPQRKVSKFGKPTAYLNPRSEIGTHTADRGRRKRMHHQLQSIQTGGVPGRRTPDKRPGARHEYEKGKRSALGLYVFPDVATPTSTSETMMR